ncbi:HNH endonuclease [Shigella flexneri]|nr:HNH endonuclease [Shigella flexneri]
MILIMIEMLKENLAVRNGVLIWIKNGRRRTVGKAAGAIMRNSEYRYVQVNGYKDYAHRIAWMIQNESMIPCGMEIDHIDGNKRNDDAENLRLVTHDENMRNLPIYKSNTSGISGVSFDKKLSKWRASASVNGKKVHIGYFESIEDAAIARKKFDENNGYHKNRGRKNDY